MNIHCAASAPTPDQFYYDDQTVASQPLSPLPLPRLYTTNITSPEPSNVEQNPTNQGHVRLFAQPPISQRPLTSHGQLNSPHESAYVNDSLHLPQQPPVNVEPVEPSFNPMQWMANVTSLGMNSDKPTDGSLHGVIMAVDSFQKGVVDKMAFMRQNHASMWPPEMWDTITRNVTARADALQQTVTSWRQFDKACNDVERDLGLIAQQLNTVGELSVFMAGLQPQLQKLNSVGTRLARVEEVILQSKVEFAVPVKAANRDEIRDVKAQLHMKYKSLRDRHQYQLAQAKSSKRLIEHYQKTNAQIVSERGEVATMIENCMRSNSNDGSNVIVQVLMITKKFKRKQIFF